MKRILVLDTSVLCVWLKVPGKSRCSTWRDSTTGLGYKQIDNLLKREEEKGSTFVLPMAAIIEAGNHISQADKRRYEVASELARVITKTARADTPWAAFTDQGALWSSDGLMALANEFPQLAARRLSLGDATIKNVAEYYARAGWEVQILTCDRGLQSYEPESKPLTPRRRL